MKVEINHSLEELAGYTKKVIVKSLEKAVHSRDIGEVEAIETFMGVMAQYTSDLMATRNAVNRHLNILNKLENDSSLRLRDLMEEEMAKIDAEIALEKALGNYE